MYTTKNGGCGANFDPYAAPFYLDLEEETLEAMVYPNPTNKDVFVKVLDAGQFHVQVVDIHGHQVYNNERYLKGEAIDTEQWGSGVYIMNIATEKGTAIRKLIRR